MRLFSNRDKEDALLDAAERGDGKALNALLKTRVNVNARDVYGYTALMFAAIEGDAAMANALLDRGARPNMKTVDGKTALYMAVGREKPEVVKILLERGANPNDKILGGRTSLEIATKMGFTEIVKLLLDAGADANQISKDGRTLIERSATSGHAEVVQLLLDAGAKEDPRIPELLAKAPKWIRFDEEKEARRKEDGSGYRARDATEADLPGIAEMFRRNDYGPKEVDWLRWKYLENPDGASLMYLAEDSAGTIVAFQARMMRRYGSASTGEFMTRQTVDMFVDPDHRKGGLLRKIYLFENVEEQHVWLGFPNKISLQPGPRARIIPLYDWFFPVFPGQLITGKPYGFLAPIADMFSRIYAFVWLGGKPKNLRMEKVARFTKDFELDADLIHGARTADYLNWRFIDNRMRSYSAYEFFDGDTSIGYCVYSKMESSVEIFDFIASRHHRGCLRLLFDHCRSNRISHLPFRGSNLNLGRFGFWRRPPESYCILGTTLEYGPMPKGRWYLTLADSDY